MNYEQHTLRELKAMCSREPRLFRGFSRFCKVDLITFMEEKRASTIPNNQGEDPPVGPPPWDLSEYYPNTSEQQYLNIQDSLENRIFDNFSDAERETMETLNQGRWRNGSGEITDMNPKELVIFHLHNIAIDEYEYNIFQVINDIIEPEAEGGNLLNNDDILALTEIVRRECITEMKPPCPECPVCYERKPGMMVETTCKHTLCFMCLNETWKARCGTQKWMDRQCPICRAQVDDMTFF